MESMHIRVGECFLGSDLCPHQQFLQTLVQLGADTAIDLLRLNISVQGYNYGTSAKWPVGDL